MTRRPLAIVLACIALGLATIAAAQTIESRDMTTRWRGGVPYVGAQLRGVVDSRLRARLHRAAPPPRVVTRVYAYDQAGNPIAVSIRSCTLQFDVWELRYRVLLQTATVDRTISTLDFTEVLTLCFDLADFPVGRTADWAGRDRQSAFFAVLLELNPPSSDMMHRFRRWLARPDGRLGGDTFFGSFVGLFLNRRLAEAERAFRFRSSQEVTVP